MTASLERSPESLLGTVRTVLALRSVKVALGAALALGIGCALSPLTAVLGVESALVIGLVLPPFAAAMGARLAIRARAGNVAGAALTWEVLVAAKLVFVPSFVLSLGAALFVRWCSPVEGLAFYVLGPGLGVTLAVIAGLALGVVVPGPRTATTLAALTPVALALVGLWRFYSTPAIYSYAHFAGYFPGTLYDPDVEISSEYLSRIFLVPSIRLSSLFGGRS